LAFYSNQFSPFPIGKPRTPPRSSSLPLFCRKERLLPYSSHESGEPFLGPPLPFALLLIPLSFSHFPTDSFSTIGRLRLMILLSGSFSGNSLSECAFFFLHLRFEGTFLIDCPSSAKGSPRGEGFCPSNFPLLKFLLFFRSALGGLQREGQKSYPHLIPNCPPLRLYKPDPF